MKVYRVNIRDTRPEHYHIAAKAAQIFVKPEHRFERYLFLAIANGEDDDYYRVYCWRNDTYITVRVDAKGEDCSEKGEKPNTAPFEVPLQPK